MRRAAWLILFPLSLAGRLAADAAQVYWTGYQHDLGSFPDEGSFFDGNVWLDYVPPTAADTAIFGWPLDMPNSNANHNPHHVFFGNFAYRDFPQDAVFIPGGAASVEQLGMLGDSWIFDFGSGATGGADFPPLLTGSLTADFATIGSFGPSAASLTIQGGTLTLTHPEQWSMVISGDDTLPKPELVVDGPGAVVSAEGDINVGNWLDSHGRLAVLGGGEVHARAVYGWSQADILVRGEGSLIDALNGATDGSIVIDQGGRAVAGLFGFNLGWWDSPLAKATVQGSGSVLESTEIDVGGYYGLDDFAIGRGELEVISYGKVTGYWLYAARSPGSTGNIRVSSHGSLVLETDMVIGELGHATMTIEDNGSAKTESLGIGLTQTSTGELFVKGTGRLDCWTAQVGVLPSSKGSARIEGSQARWTIDTILSAGAEFGPANASKPGGTATLEIRSGALVEVGSLLDLGPAATADLRANPQPNCLGCGWSGGRLRLGGDPDADLPEGTARCGTDATLVVHVRKQPTLASGRLLADRIEFAGTLRVLADGDPLADGDVLQLFDADEYTGTFDHFELPALAAGLQWDTSKLGVNGTLAVVTPPPPPPILGDVNDDGSLDRADVTALLEKIRTRTTDLSFDYNGDGKVDVADARKLLLMIGR